MTTYEFLLDFDWTKKLLYASMLITVMIALVVSHITIY